MEQRGEREDENTSRAHQIEGRVTEKEPGLTGAVGTELGASSRGPSRKRKSCAPRDLCALQLTNGKKGHFGKCSWELEGLLLICTPTMCEFFVVLKS